MPIVIAQNGGIKGGNWVSLEWNGMTVLWKDGNGGFFEGEFHIKRKMLPSLSKTMYVEHPLCRNHFPNVSSNLAK